MWIIADKSKAKEERLPVFCKKFNIDKSVSKCVMKITALGIFNIVINGTEIKDYFMPGWTNYGKYVNLCTYDITEYLQKDNRIEVTVASGWYSGMLGYSRQKNVYGNEKALFASIETEFQDGTTERITTDGSWKVGRSRITSSSFFMGEKVDFSFVENEYETLRNAVVYDYSTKFNPYGYQPVNGICTLKPETIGQDEGSIKLDFKQNFAGFVSFNVSGEKGGKVIVRYAEVLNEDGSLYFDNLRKAVSTDTLILSGGVDAFEPKFTYHGFRYAEIVFEKPVEIRNIKGVVLSQNLEYNGDFTCSDAIVNKIFQNVLWGQRSNFISIPTDCPQRDERLGWTGDAEVFCNTAMYNCDCNKFFANYMQLVRTDMREDGGVTSFVPFFIPVSESTVGVAGWADGICIIPYYHYLHYRDKQILTDNVDCAVKHYYYYERKSSNYLINYKNPFGDWLSVKENTDTNVINQVFFGLTAFLISKIYGILGNETQKEFFFEKYLKIKEAFRTRYLKDGKISSDTQTAYAISLSVGFVDANEIKDAFANSVIRNGYKLTTGFIGVKYLLPALCEIGRSDLAYKIIKQKEYPSWGYTIENGATTVWERWNGYTKENGFETPSMNSFNHYSLGSCVEWLYSYVLGIKLNENGNITVSPSLSEELGFAKGKYKSVNGYIYVDWKSENGKYICRVKADEGVAFTCDFSAYNVESVEKGDNAFTITVIK